MAPKVTPGVYRHYKGGLYRVFGVADYTGEHGDVFPSAHHPKTEGFPEGEKLVVYIGLYDNPRGNRLCTRPVREWVAKLVLTAKDGYPGGRVVEQRYERIGD